MADWTQTSEGKGGKGRGAYKVWSTDLVNKEVGSGVEGHNWTPVIDFIPPGTDFQVIANTAATNTSASSPVMLYVGYTIDAAIANRYRQNHTPFISLTSEVDTATPILFRDVSTYGQFPYYWLKVPAAGGAINIKVIVGRGATEVVG